MYPVRRGVSHMVRFDIIPDKTALLVIDMQKVFLENGSPLEIPRGRELVPILNRLISMCRSKGIMVIFVKQAHRANRSDLGLYTKFVPVLAEKPVLLEGMSDIDIYDGLDMQEDDTVVVKRTFSAFYCTDLDHVLRVNGIDTLIISGIATHSCCEATARDARHRNYKVIFLSDGTATYDRLPDAGWGEISGDDVQRFVLTMMALRNAEVIPTCDIIERLKVTS